MKSKSNSLGIGITGNTYNLIPKNIGIKTIKSIKSTRKYHNVNDNTSQNTLDSMKHNLEENNLENKDTNTIPQDYYYSQWDILFNQVATNSLYSNFKNIKEKLLVSSVFNKTRLVYINLEIMRFLIEYAKNNKYEKPLMSLKTYVKQDSQTLINPIEMDQYIFSIQMVEQLGPPENVIICLEEFLIDVLSENNYQVLYWPTGQNGITWITNK